MPIVVDVEVKLDKGLERLGKSLTGVNASVKSLRDMFREMANDSQRIARNLGAAGGGGPGRRTGGGRGIGPPQAPTRRGAPPVQQFQTVQEAMQFLNDPSTQAGIAGGNIAVQKRARSAQTAINRSNRLNRPAQGFGDRLANLLKRSRFGIGGGVMPLGIDILKIFGLGGGAGAAGGAAGGAAAGGAAAAAGPLVIALAAVTIAVKAWTAAVKSALKVGGEAGRGAALTGGTIGQFQAIQGFAALLGTDPVSLARGVSAGTKGGLGGAVGASIGISPVPRAFDPQSDTAKLDILIREITGSSEQRAKFLARATGQEELLRLRNLTPGQLQELRDVAVGLATTEHVKAAESLNVEMVKLQFAFQKLATSDAVLGTIRLLTVLTDVFNMFFKGLTTIMESPLVAAVLGPVFAGLGAAGRSQSGRSIAEMEIDSRERMIGAMDQWGRIAKDHAEVLGGDVRARRALPPGAGENLVYGSRRAVFEMELGLL